MGNPEYMELSETSIRLYNEIHRQLPGNSQTLLCEYEQIMNLKMAIAHDVMYEHGLKDGIRLRFRLFN